MSGEHDQASNPLPAKRHGLWKIYRSGERANVEKPAQEAVQCANCSQVTVSKEQSTFCSFCGSSFVAYSGHANSDPNLVPISHEVYYLTPPRRTIDQRRHRRISCKSVQACIRTEQRNEFIVDLLNISKGGVAFTSFYNFPLHSRVLIATHYYEGGQNIFQEGLVVRVQRKPTSALPGEFAIQFSHDSGL